MHITTVTMIGNECEIIESFVRYHCNIVDRMLFIYDSGCVDSTVDILKLLQREGLPVELYDEALVSYEQSAMENKYLRLAAKQEKAELLIPLDADEFITADIEPRQALEGLAMDKVYEIYWQNYQSLPEDDNSEQFIPRRITYCEKARENFTKVIIPAVFIREYGAYVTTGHHHVKGIPDFSVEKLEKIYLAHYPFVSQVQYQSKLRCNVMRYITWLNREDRAGFHLNKQLAKIESGQDDFYRSSDIYSRVGDERILQKKPLNISYWPFEKLQIRYGELSRVNVMENVQRTGEIMALKAYNLLKEKEERQGRPCVLIYGTGNTAKELLRDHPANLVNIRAYINSDVYQRFTIFQRCIVVTPEMARLFPYDKIIIASRVYAEEMRISLLECGVKAEKIVSEEYLLQLSIEAL